MFSQSENGMSCTFDVVRMMSALNGSGEFGYEAGVTLTMRKWQSHEPAATLLSFLCTVFRHAVSHVGVSHIFVGLVRSVSAALPCAEAGSVLLVLYTDKKLDSELLRDISVQEVIEKQWLSGDGLTYVLKLCAMENTSPETCKWFYESNVLAPFRMCTTEASARVNFSLYYGYSNNAEELGGVLATRSLFEPLVPGDVLYENELLQWRLSASAASFSYPTVGVVDEEGLPVGLLELGACVGMKPSYIVARRVAVCANGQLIPEAYMCVNEIKQMCVKRKLLPGNEPVRCYNEEMQYSAHNRELMMLFITQYYNKLIEMYGSGTLFCKNQMLKVCDRVEQHI